MRRLLLLFVLVAIAATSQADERSVRGKGYVIVTRYVKANGKRDVSDKLQRVIDRNPNRTIYFPDGVYLISKPICTPAEPTKSVSLELSNYATIRATADWDSEEAMIRLGGKDAANNIRVPGSNYYLEGGIIDGNGVAKAISIDSGRETQVRNTSIKRATVGLHIKYGANNGSSDCDIMNVNITGSDPHKSIGVIVDGHDNTLTNMRIGGVHTGVLMRASGNMLRNIHPLFYGNRKNYATSCGFKEEKGTNRYDYCYSDEFATAFEIARAPSLFVNCFAYWYSNKATSRVAFRAKGQFNARVVNMSVGYTKRNAIKKMAVLEVGKGGGRGYFDNLHLNDPRLVKDKTHEPYVK